MTKHYSCTLNIIACLIWSIVIHAQEPGEWNQLGGPNRNFHIESVPLAKDWPTDGPRRLWSRLLGEGYSSIVVDGGMLFTMYRDGDTEIVVALNAGTGNTLWHHASTAPLEHNGYVDIWLNAAGPGPYSTPLVVNDSVFAVGIEGRFDALDKQTGNLLWSLDLVEQFNLSEYNAFASSPLAFGGTVILPLGGSAQGVVAFEQDTGSVIWRSSAFSVAPGSPLLINVDGQDQIVVVGQQALVGLNPASGRQLWQHPHENELGLNISMPVWGEDNRLFASSAYNGGSQMVHLSQIDGRTTPDEQWSTNRMRVHFSNALRLGTTILGSSGDFGPAFLTALDAETGQEQWRDRAFARAHMLYADEKLVIVDEDGDVAIASISNQGLQIHARQSVMSANSWTPPTLVDGILFVRDRKEIVAFDLRRQE